MKVIFSRKGFDSSSGGVPSAIFQDGTMVSLPIPDKASTTAYQDIAANQHASTGRLVEDLARIPATHRAHLDPDLAPDALPRMRGWRPLFGQVGAAEKHLENNGVGQGDLFLFFGLFRRVETIESKWKYVRGSRPIHVIFGWLQVAERIRVSQWPGDAAWALYHPHFHRDLHPTNVVYVASEQLAVPGLKSAALPGAGLFQRLTPKLQLTEPQRSRPSLWLLPEWFWPENRRSSLSFHADLGRWRKRSGGVELSSVARGQEFVLDGYDYPEVFGWLADLFGPPCPPR